MTPSPAAALETIVLPGPAMNSPAQLDSALARRRTVRAIAARPLSPQTLSNLLWAAFGVNRAEGPFGAPGRTAASASNSQEIDLYVALEAGVYLYDADHNALEPIVAGDVRALALTPHQHGVAATGPAHFIYVADVRRMTHTRGFDEPGLHDPEVQKSYYYVDTGMIAANVQLYAAAHGFAAWFHNCDRPGLAKVLGLGAQQRVLFAQSVGYSADGS